MSSKKKDEGAQRDPEVEEPNGPPSPPARQTKLAALLELISREGGASLDELAPVTGWLPHTTRAAVTGLRKQGHSIHCKRVDGSSRYLLGKGDQ